MKGRNPLDPTPETIRAMEKYDDAVLEAIRACSAFSGTDRRAADHVLFRRAVTTSDRAFSESRWRRESK